jgi:hypothetical protein
MTYIDDKLNIIIKNGYSEMNQPQNNSMFQMATDRS